jgi:iron complex outermembrane receptor protein
MSGLSAMLITFAFAQEKPAEKDSFYILSPVEVKAVRASNPAPVTKTNLSKKDIDRQNLGEDLPYLLNQTPSVVVHSDAGNGIGYTGLQIRGTDATRINVTLNGIPYNDAESQQTYFVDLPDIASSINSIQIQRGVGSSSNGAGAFGATINLSTNELNKDAYAEINNSYGSYNSWKNTFKTGSGLIANHFSMDFRFSSLSSDGYIDRASTKLHSFYLSTAYTGKSNSLRFNIIQGHEKTYQAWYGISEEDLKAGNRRINYAGMERPGSPYDNETDNYQQDHYQLFYTHRFSRQLSFNTAFFYTKGMGYYEEYRADQPYSMYHLPEPVNGPDTSFTSDFVRQLWLDNDFYGNIFSVQYENRGTQLTVGGGWTNYLGDHYGELTWASNGLTGMKSWYNVDAKKQDLNLYSRLLQRLFPNWNGYIDLQYRGVDYHLNGFENNPDLFIHNKYDFFNPRIGLSYVNKDWNNYISFSVASKEPNRDDFEASVAQQPKPEILHDVELGIEKKNPGYVLGATLYYMQYKDQLVLTGRINDVGAYTRTNIPQSYRAGIELQATAKPYAWLEASTNLSLSQNKVKDFTEYIDDYDNGGQKINLYRSTDIAFSPSKIAAATISFFPTKNIELSLLSKYVDKQYLDNTQNENRKLNAFYTQDARLTYRFHKDILKEGSVILQVNNIFSKKYEPNGYTYSYISGGELTTGNYYFPMAPVNFFFGLNMRF